MTKHPPSETSALITYGWPSFEIEGGFWEAGFRYIAGLDEAGRGCLAGPVVAAAVILSNDASIPGLNDSKKLTGNQRELLIPIIRREALAVGVGQCSPTEIDRLNILQASLEAMRRAIEALALPPDMLLVDGNRRIPKPPCPQETVVKGDSKSLSIAAASVVAKVTRDKLMVELDSDFPFYGWAAHKGYPTVVHYDALAAHGPSPHHRLSFKLVR